MKESSKVKIISSIFLVSVILLLSAAILIINGFKNKEDKNLENSSVMGSSTSTPFITSLAPIEGFVGKEYRYLVKYSDMDSEAYEISIDLLESPSWLKLDGQAVVGTPPIGSIGSFKFVLRISDGTNSSLQENYILIGEDSNEDK